MTTGRPIQFDPDVALGAAMQAFWHKGYEATSLNELLEATRLSKSSLYQAFGGKQEIFGRCISRYTDQMVAQLRERLQASESAVDFIRTTLIDVASEGKRSDTPQGCLIMNTAAEIGQRDPQFAQWVEHGLARIRVVFESAVTIGQHSGELSLALPAPVVADYLMSSIAGLRTMVKAGTKPRAVLKIVDVIVSALR